MTWIRVKRWLASMKRKRKGYNNKNCPVTESKVAVAETMSALGRPCERLPTQYVKNCGHIPVVLTNAAFVIEKNLKTKGLFQTQGNVSKVNACLNQLLAPRLSKIKHENVHDVIEAMKTFLVRLPEPLMPESVCDALISRSPEEDSTSQYVAVLTKFRNSSPGSFAILQFMMLLLKRISEYSEYNTMDVRKLATVFVLDIIKPLKLEDSNEGLFLIERMQRLPYLIMVVETIIKQVDIFQVINNTTDARSWQAGSPILVEQSNNGSSHAQAGHRSNSSETHGLTNPTSDGNEDSMAGATSQHDEVGEFHSSQMRDLRNEHNDRSPMKPPEQVARALSEPRKETAHAADICKRCVTALPVCASGMVSEMASSTGDTARDLSSTNVTVIENPIEVSLEPAKEAYSAGAAAADAAQRKTDLSRTATLGGKKYCTSQGATCSPVRRKSAKKDEEDPYHNPWEVKAHRSMDINVPAAQNKRKRKCRSTSKKPKLEPDRSLAESSGRGSDFTTFQPDEEITPWNEGSTNSDDTSIMVKTIRNPRVLAHAASTPIKFENQVEGENVQKLKERLVSSDKVSRLFLANYGFRTISSQNNLPTTPGSCQTTSSSDTSFCEDLICPTPDVFGQSSSNNTTPISKELIRGVKLKGSIGVNTSPCLEFSIAETKSDDVQRASEKHKESPKVKTPVTRAKEIKAIPQSSTVTLSRFIPPTPAKITAQVPAIAEFGAHLRGQVSGIHSSINYSQYHHPRLPVPNQLTVSGRSHRCGSHIKLRHQQLRRALKSSNSSLEQKTGRNSLNDACAPSLFIKEWFVDTILAFITVLCISLIFLVYEHDKPRGGWLK